LTPTHSPEVPVISEAGRFSASGRVFFDAVCQPYFGERLIVIIIVVVVIAASSESTVATLPVIFESAA